MSFLESFLYFVVWVGLCLASLYYFLTNQDIPALEYGVYACLVCAWVIVRMLWVATRTNRELRKILNEVQRRRTQG